MEKERDFYYSKLRDIEMMVQEESESDGTKEICAKVLDILYATQVQEL